MNKNFTKFLPKYFSTEKKVSNINFSGKIVCFSVAFFSVFLLFMASSYAQNAIVSENLLTGNPATEWDISGAGDLSIQGFATDISVNKGETVHFKIKTDDGNYSINIYRIGYYQGKGARKVGTGVITATLPQTQPDDLYDTQTGLTDCGNWGESAHWDVPSNAVSGIYIARLTRSNGGSSHIAFIVRDDASHSNLFFQTSDATWQAYNVYGGNSLYVGSTSFPAGHAAKVSYNRPFLTRNGGGGGGEAEDWLFNAEYPMIRWLERNGYDMTYTTDVDQVRRGSLIKNHKVFMSVGHDEYWSAEQRTSVEAARSAGVHLAFFGGNECYWKTRWEASADGSNTPYRTLVCYKEGTLGENQCNQKCDPLPNTWTGLWRDGCGANYNSNDGCKPENALSGQISWDGTTGTIEVPDTYKNLRFWRNTDIATLGSGQKATLTANTLGYEWDWEQYTSSYPAGRITLSSTTLNGHTHKLSLYKYSSGALVFGAGTVQWSWGLDGTHDRGGSTVNKNMQQATVNLFADMGVQPGILQSDLVTAAASSDNQAPVSAITAPANGSSVQKGTAVTITGTASDVGGVVAGVEVSTDGGTTWKVASGTTNWTYTWTPGTTGNVTVKSRAFDDIGNIENGSSETSVNAITVTVTEASVTCPCTVFQSTDVPATPKENDNTPIELGFKFRSSQDGYITGIRFYKGSGTTGTHLGHLWSSDGTQLAEATFANEGASGWQEVSFANPVSITANTTYVASMHSSSGDYAYTNPYFTDAVNNGPLTGLANGDDGPNGVYKYSSASAFPDQNYQSSNYWIDVVFNTSVGPDVTPPSVSSTSPSNGANGVNTASAINIIFNEAISSSTVSGSTIELRNDANAVVSSTISYTSGTRTASITPASALAYSKTYSGKVKGGSADPRIKDLAGNALANDYTFTFTTSAPPPPPPTEGPGGPILVISSATNPFSRYTVEILRAEGLNEFKAMDISKVTASVLNSYDVVILGEMTLSSSNVSMLTDWTNAGGTLITLKPDTQLATLLGITPVGTSQSDKYLLVNTNTIPGKGIVNQTIQYHGPADRYTLNGATSLATLYSDASTATVYPAVTTRNVGTHGGVAVAFTYDLARSVVYTRQGNPAWAGQKRDGQIDPIRSDDQFFPDYIDFNKIAIPQADEQQHLLSNIIIKNNLHRKPLPKFWFLPKGLKAAVVMTGDDHGDAGMKPRFDINISESPAGCSVDDWECVRSTGYLYVGSTFTDVQAKQYNDLGFEVALHVNTDCNNFTAAAYQNFITNQSADFHSAFPSIPLPSTNRNHCIAWSDWSIVPEVEAANGMRLDVNYYYWPEAWIKNRPGMFTGSGMPMRFAKIDGTIIDCYQATTQMPDESGETFPAFADALLDKAIGSEGYYGVFTTNMHFDNPNHPGANAVVASAKARGIPVVSAKQMLDWLDGRNSSTFDTITWNTNSLSFSIAVGTGARNLQAMLPVASANGQLTAITRNGSAVTYKTDTIKGIKYAFFTAAAGNYVAMYTSDNVPPVITEVTATPNSDGTATITWKTDKAADSKVDYGTTVNSLTLDSADLNLVTSHSITINNLTNGSVYYFRVTSTDAANNSTVQPALANTPLNFTVPAAPAPPCANDKITADFSAGTTGANTLVSLDGDGSVILTPALNEEFSGSSIPKEFTEGVFNAGGTDVSNGQVTVNGTHIFSNNSFTPGSSVEFVATFNSAQFQNIGFSGDQPFDNAPWITIGQGANPDGNLYARASDGSSINLGSNLLGAAHRYRIQWNTSSFDFYVDGGTTPAATINLAVSANMFLQISDVQNSDGKLSVDWMRVSPYAASGSFTSRVFDGGAAKTWGAVKWNADTLTGTHLDIFVRTGDTQKPDASWTAFTKISPSGTSVGRSSRYIQYRADLSTSNNITPVLKNISIDCDATDPDETPPVITNTVAVPAAGGTSVTITWTTDEASDSKVVYGTSAAALNQNSSDNSLVTSHTITLSGLTAGTAYYYRIISKDASNNSKSEPDNSSSPLSFSTPAAPCFEDITSADFGSGTTGSSTYISNIEDGEVILKPAAGTDFSQLPSTTEWNSFSWTGGSSTVSGGLLSVNGARYNSEPASTTYTPGTSLEFVATFGAAGFQHSGFGGGTDATGAGGMYNGEEPWAMFSTKNTSSTLYARTFLPGNTPVDFEITGIANPVGTSHKFRIDWKADGTFEYYIDGNLVRTESVSISSAMRPGISDYNNDAVPITVDWIRVTPYSNSGTFESRINDAGAIKNWNNISWISENPTNTSITISVRKGNSPSIDATWTPYSAVSASGDTVGGKSRYIQYKADLSTTNTNATPVLKSVSISCSPYVNKAPVLNTIGSKTVTAGQTLSFTATASDEDTDQTLTFSLANGAPQGASINATSGVFSWTPSQAGNYQVTVVVTDNGSPAKSDQEQITITVSNATVVNKAPVLDSIGNKTAIAGVAFSFTATASDSNANQTLTFSLINAPANAAINATTGVFNWTPATTGSYTFKVSVADNGSPSLSDQEQITVTVISNSVFTLSPLADAYVRNGTYATKNYGSDTSLIIKSSVSAGFTRSSFLKFSVNGLSNVSLAKLRIYGRNADNTANIKMSTYGLDNDSWTESGITWNNAPVTSSAALGVINVNNTAKYYEIDVTNFVKTQAAGDKTVSFLVKDASNQDKNLLFNSKENSQNKPQLVVTAVNNDVTPPVVTIQFDGTSTSANTYIGQVGIIINSSDDGGSGLASTQYSLNGAAYKNYNGSFIINTPGNYTIKAKAVDGKGNTTVTDQIAFSVVSQPVTQTLSPLADAYVRNGTYATKNYGSDTSLIIKSSVSAGFTRSSFLKFSVNGLSNVSLAKLRIYGRNADNTANIKMSTYGLDNDSWTESGITWNNAPVTSSAALGVINVNNTAKYYEIDVTNFVKTQAAGDKTVSFLVKDASNQDKNLLFNSKENEQNKPQLVVTAVSSGSASKESSKYYVDILSSEDNSTKPRVFPNPLQNRFDIKFPAAYKGDFTIQILDPSGKIYSADKLKLNSGGLTVPVDITKFALRAGVYFLKIQSETKSEIIKLIVQN